MLWWEGWSVLWALSAVLRAEIAGPLDCCSRCTWVMASMRVQIAQRDGELASLRAEVADLTERRLKREREWVEYARLLAAIDPAVLPEKRFEPDPELLPPPFEPSAPEGPSPELLERSQEVRRSLRTLLQVEQVRGLDLLECGLVQDGHVESVLFRSLDGQGRLCGSLFAEKLRLEGSRAARTLTLVLEGGYESRGGVRTPFPREQRRIVLPHVDPMPWVEVLPELFGDQPFAAERDDGTWNKNLVRFALNRLLREETSGGYYSLRSLEGVSGGCLLEVQLEAFRADGALDRRIFADRLTILPMEREERGITLLLEDGVHLRGEVKAPFLEGRFRIFLPRADPARWRAAGLPGLEETPRAIAIPEVATPGEDEPGTMTGARQP